MEKTTELDTKDIITMHVPKSFRLIRDQIIGLLVPHYLENFTYISDKDLYSHHGKQPEDVIREYRDDNQRPETAANLIISYPTAGRIIPESFKVLFIHLKDIESEQQLEKLYEQYDYIVNEIDSVECIAERIIINYGYWNNGRPCNRNILNDIVLRDFFATYPVVSIIGQTGCGKETQTKAMLHRYKVLVPDSEVYVCETGMLFRTKTAAMTPFNRAKMDKIQDSGSLQSPTLATVLWGHQYLHEYNNQGMIVVDGSPRSCQEVRSFIDVYRDLAEKEIVILHITISDQEAAVRAAARNQKRVAAGLEPRADTATPEALAKKLAYYHTDIKPALACIKAEHGVTIYDIDGMKTPTLVMDKIIFCLARHQRESLERKELVSQ